MSARRRTPIIWPSFFELLKIQAATWHRFISCKTSTATQPSTDGCRRTNKNAQLYTPPLFWYAYIRPSLTTLSLPLSHSPLCTYFVVHTRSSRFKISTPRRPAQPKACPKYIPPHEKISTFIAASRVHAPRLSISVKNYPISCEGNSK